MSEWFALVFRRVSFAKHMPWIWRWDDLHIRKTRRPIVVDPAIEADCGAAMNRLLSRDEGVVHKVDRLLALYREKPARITK